MLRHPLYYELRTPAEYMRDNPPPSPRQWLPKCRECGGHGADPLSDNVNWLPCKSCGGSGVESSAEGAPK